MIKKILVAFDGSTYSRKALEEVCDLVRCLNAEVTALYVIPKIPPHAEPELKLPSLDPSYLGFLKEQGTLILENAERIAKERGMEIVTALEHGYPVDVICKYAYEGGFDLVVLGSRGIHGSKLLPLGSVSERVARVCKKSVLIVK